MSLRISPAGTLSTKDLPLIVPPSCGTPIVVTVVDLQASKVAQTTNSRGARAKQWTSLLNGHRSTCWSQQE